MHYDVFVLTVHFYFSDPHKLGIRCRVNGKVMQDSNTENLVFKTEALVCYISRWDFIKPYHRNFLLVYAGCEERQSFICFHSWKSGWWKIALVCLQELKIYDLYSPNLQKNLCSNLLERVCCERWLFIIHFKNVENLINHLNWCLSKFIGM